MKRTYLSILFAVLLLFALPLTAAAVNEQENNNDMTSATPIPYNQDISGSTVDCEDTDWYQITLPSDGMITISFEHPIIPDDKNYWEVDIYRPDGENLKIHANNIPWGYKGNLEHQTIPEVGLPAGIYYIKLQPHWRLGYTDLPYTLRVNYTPSAFWEKEPNPSSTSPTKLEVNTDYFGTLATDYDADWYAVTLPEDGALTIKFSHPPYPDDSFANRPFYDIYLYRRTENGLLARVYSSFFNSIQNFWEVLGGSNLETVPTGLPAGTYYIEVHLDSTQRYSPAVYTIHLAYDTENLWETEPNKTALTADILTLNTICNASLWGQGGLAIDWYAFDVDSPTKMNLSLQSSSDRPKVWLWSRDLESVLVNIEDSGTHSLGELEPGRYYLKVFSEDNGGIDDYTYSLKLTEEHDHAFTTWITTQESTCTQQGTRTSSCDICGDMGYQGIELLPHQFAEPVYISGSKLRSPIIYHEICQNCGYTEVIEDHQYAWMLPTLLGAGVLLAGCVVFLVSRRKR